MEEQQRPLVQKRVVKRWRSSPIVFRVPMVSPVQRPDFNILTARRAGAILFIYISLGVVSFFFLRNGFAGTTTTPFLDGLYFSIITMTTVSYGDLVPASVAAKLFTCVYVILGLAIIGLIVGQAAGFIIEKQHHLFDKAFEVEEEVDPEDAKLTCARHRAAFAGCVCVVVLVLGVLVLVFLEGLTLVDAFVCVCGTVTTLGYGQVAFQSFLGRCFACVWVLVSTACVARFIYLVAEMITEQGQHSLVRWALSRAVTVADLEAADMDNDYSMSASEFVIYKLKELGKIKDGDVRAILKQFEECDTGHCGKISISQIDTP